MKLFFILTGALILFAVVFLAKKSSEIDWAEKEKASDECKKVCAPHPCIVYLNNENLCDLTKEIR